MDELKALWKGIKIKVILSILALKFRAAVLCVSDVPATRKICGFKGHSAQLGCLRCLKKFLGGFREERDCSGFNRSEWNPRASEEHRRTAIKINQCKTKALGQQNGITHYSILLRLYYFDVIRLCTADPMHNLFHETAKGMFKLWTDSKLFPPSQLSEIEERVKSVEVPSDIGRLPMRITSDCGSYTAEQWKTGHSFTLFSAFKVFYQRNIFGASRNLCQHVNFC